MSSQVCLQVIGKHISMLQASDSTGNHPIPQSRDVPNNYSSARDRPSEEAERIKENQDVKASFGNIFSNY